MRIFRSTLVFSLVLISSLSIKTFAADVAGSSDHPLIGRFSGSEILGYKQFNFNEYLFQEGDIVRDEDNNFVYSDSSWVEGKLTRIYYIAPPESSVAEVARNYTRQLESQGFEEVYACRGEAYNCGFWASYMENFKPELIDYAYNVGENRLMTFKKSDPAGDIYASLLVFNYTFDHFRDRYNRPAVQLDIVEAEALDDGQMEVVTADRIASQVNDQGRIAIYGIHFDTGKSELKQESLGSIEQINEAMTNDPALTLHVVGHTDNEGSLDFNMQLSKDRANAVVAKLVEFGVEASRLTANGVASLAPVSTNQTEEGRAKNRRVELVAQ